MQCTICLSDEGEVVQKGCHCRGDAGAAHLDCLIESATHAADSRGDSRVWLECGTCKAAFSGTASHGLTQAWFARVESQPQTDSERCWALLALACESSVQSGDYVEAARLAQQVHAAQTEAYGEEARATLSTATTLASIYRYIGDYTKARELQAKTVTTMARIYGEDDLETLSGQIELAIIHRNFGNYEEALAINRRAVDACTRVAGPDSVLGLDAMTGLATTLSDLNRMDEAVTVTSELVARQTRIQGEAHPGTLNTMLTLSVLHMKQDNFARAEAVARQTLAHYRTAHVDGHPNIKISLHNIGVYCVYGGRPAEGERYISEAIEAAKAVRGFDQQLLSFFHTSHGQALSKLGRNAEAVAVLRREHSRQVGWEALGPNHPSTLRTASLLGAALVARGCVVRGRTLLRETLAVQKSQLGEHAFDTRQTAKSLAECPIRTVSLI